MSGEDAPSIIVHAASNAAPRQRPVKATRVELERESSVADAFGILVRDCTSQMQANAAGLRAGRNAEFLHQFRVGLRRLRSVFRLYRPLLATANTAALTSEMSRLSGALGVARDWDVFVGETVAPLVRDEPGVAGLAAFKRRCDARRRLNAAAAQQAFDPARYAAFMRDLERCVNVPHWARDAAAQRLLALPLTAFAAERLARREKNVRRRAESLDTADAAHCHRLRIATKKLRYAVECVQSLFERKAARDYAAALAQMQDALGQLNDCTTARRLLEAVPAGRNADADTLARALVHERLAMREQRAVIALDIACNSWRAHKKFWKPALAGD